MKILPMQAKELFRSWNSTFPVVRYLALTLRFVSYILARIIVKSIVGQNFEEAMLANILKREIGYIS